MSSFGSAPLGHIRYQVGLSISAIRTNIEQQDTNGVVNHLRFLIAIAAPKIPKTERDALRVPSMPDERSDPDGSKESEVFESCMVTLERVLSILSDHGLYAWNDPPAGDAGGLALRDEADAEGGT